MYANIKTAASLLRSSSYQLQTRIRQLRVDEHSIQRRTEGEERNIKSDLLDTGRKMAVSNDPNSKTFLIKRSYDLYQRSKRIKADADKKLSSEEKEIRSLEAQSRRLDELAHTLEMWSL